MVSERQVISARSSACAHSDWEKGERIALCSQSWERKLGLVFSTYPLRLATTSSANSCVNLITLLGIHWLWCGLLRSFSASLLCPPSSWLLMAVIYVLLKKGARGISHSRVAYKFVHLNSLLLNKACSIQASDLQNVRGWKSPRKII